METKIYTRDEIKDQFIQVVLNHTNKISKISDNSVLSGISYGIATIAQKLMKDTALLESELFPEYAYGQYLDRIAQRSGVSPRQSYLNSSVWLRLVGVPGTSYSPSVTFSTPDGIVFNIYETVTIPDAGFCYVKAKSASSGSQTNVKANTITQISNAPSGHLYVTNEVPATGGVDIEDDKSLLSRISQNFSNFAFDTLSKLRMVLTILNPLILDVKKLGIDPSTGKVRLGIVTVNGVQLNKEELNTLSEKLINYLSISDLKISNATRYQNVVELQMIPTIDLVVDFRVDLSDVDLDLFRSKVLIEITKLFDYRNWKEGSSVNWSDIFYIVKSQSGIKSLPSEFFYLGQDDVVVGFADIAIPPTMLPSLKGFIIRDLTGNIYVKGKSNIVPYYYSSDYYPNLLPNINL